MCPSMHHSEALMNKGERRTWFAVKQANSMVSVLVFVGFRVIFVTNWSCGNTWLCFVFLCKKLVVRVTSRALLVRTKLCVV